MAARKIHQNILDEPIPEAVEKQLLKPLLPRPIPPPRKRKLEKRKAVLEQFDPLLPLTHASTKRKPGVKKALQNLTEPPPFILVKEAGPLKSYTATVPIGHHLEADILAFLNAMIPSTTAQIENELRRLGGLKVSLVLTAELNKLAPHNEMVLTRAYFWSTASPILKPDEIAQELAKATNQVMEKLEKYTKEGSGWRLKRCERLDLRTARYQPFRGRSYIKTPAYIPPRTVINVKNQDNRCFEWAILSALHPVAHGQHSDRPASYQAYRGVLNFTEIEFPVKATDVSKFERQNPGLSVNVFGWERGLYPLYISKQTGREIDLLLLVDPKDPEKTHYVWIKDLARMLYKNSKHEHRQHPCRRCLHVFSSETLLASHRNDCYGIGEKAQRTIMPEEGKNILKFTNHRKQMRVPFIIYADFEALNIPVEGCEDNPQKSYFRQSAKQVACSYCYIVVRSDGITKDPTLYRGENAVEHFLESLQTELEEIRAVLCKPADMVMTGTDQKAFYQAVDCHICGEPLGEDRVRDHCHITGKFRGAAHNACNLKLRIYPDTVKVPVVFHNLRHYDGHLIMAALGTSAATEGQKIGCIPNNMEKYMTFSVGQLQFIDSLQFMNSSLEKLAANLQTQDLTITSRDLSDNELTILRRKGVYPYEYVTGFECFDETLLPPKEAFYSHLSREGISDADYQHAQTVWETFKCHTFGDYHDIYLRTDVLLLADVFEAFRNTSIQYYGLDPAHYFSAPGMSWDALLKMTKVELELLTDIDMHLFMEKGLRGGVCMVSKRFAKANNPQCPDYDSSKQNSWIIYLDANNLYGWAMIQPLPVGGFQWVNPQLDEVLATPDDAPEGYVLEVDLDYPEQLHDAHSDYPLAPEAMTVPEVWMSDYQLTLVNELGGKFTECTKLVPNLRKKERYIVHYRNLKLYQSLGMRATKIHKAIKFRQEAWMAPYIRLNTNLRTKTTSEFENNFFKLMSNSVFGKTMENLRKRIRVDLVRASENDRMRRLVADPAYLSHRIFNGDLVAIHSTKSKLKLNRPIYIGQAILDNSKLLMYDFWYNHIKAEYGNKASLLYTDTDSLLFQVETDDVYADMKANTTQYDFSDYPRDHPNHSIENKKVVGKFKDECCSRPIIEFVGVRPKMYSILMVNGGNIRKAKGVQQAVVKKDLHHELYKQCLDEHKLMKHKQIVIHSHGHQMGVYEQNKTSLSPLDTKKWIAADGIITRAFGHYLTRSCS